jgi:hypothetical protein
MAKDDTRVFSIWSTNGYGMEGGYWERVAGLRWWWDEVMQ